MPWFIIRAIKNTITKLNLPTFKEMIFCSVKILFDDRESSKIARNELQKEKKERERENMTSL